MLQLAVGVWIARRVRTEADYLVAGRRLGYGLATATLFATWFGAETCVGAAGAVYADGLAGATHDPFGYALCLVLLGAVLAVPLWRRRFTTLGDLFRERFSPGVERLAVALMVPTSLLWGAAQIRAFGQVLAASSGLEVWTAITVAAAVVVAYTATGGLLADAWTDLLQGGVLIVGLVVLAVAAWQEGGPDLLAAVGPERLRLAPEGAGVLDVLEDWSVPIFGSVVAAELAARVLASRTPEVAQRSSFAAAGIYLAVGLIPVGLGLAAPHLVPGLADPEHALPALAQRLLPTALYVVFAGALVSAILSTVDSALLTSASLVSHNVVVRLRPGMTEVAKVRVARAFVVVFGLVAYGLALQAEGVYALVEEASAFGSAGLVVTVGFGLLTRWGGPASAAAALVVGVTAWVGAAYVWALPYPYLLSLALAALAYVAATVVPQPATARAA